MTAMARQDPRGAARQARFAGFDRDAMQFWHELAAEMSREWFAANKQRYEEQWVAPMNAVMQAVARRLAPVYRPFKLGEPKPLRIYRDVRFSRDKTPYKTHIAAVLRMAGKPIAQVGTAALYVHLGLDEEYVGVGCYQFDARKLARWRKAVVGAPGDALLAMLARLRDRGYIVDRDDDYKRVPRGLPPDHPRAELLKRKGLTCAFPEIPAGLIHEPAWADWLVRHARVTSPLVVWLHRHVG
jgi:uncharacterized protein (TIGR02453 family)